VDVDVVEEEAWELKSEAKLAANPWLRELWNK
jgi:hypothetical protein